MHRSRPADHPRLQGLIRRNVRDLPHGTEALMSALASGRLEASLALAHDLKGTGGGYGFDRITTLAAAVEQSVRTRADPLQIGRQVRELVNYTKQLDGYQPGASAA